MLEHPIQKPDAICDGGDLDCGSGLLLIIRNAMTPLPDGSLLEVRSREISVKEDLPAWCRMVGHDLVSTTPGDNNSTSYFIRKKFADPALKQDLERAQEHTFRVRVTGKQGMKAQVFVRNHDFMVGQPVSFDVADEETSAVEYLLGALGSCVAVGYQWRASQQGIHINNLEISIRAKQDNALVYLGLENDGHAGMADIELKLYVDADADEDVLKELFTKTIALSPVAQTIQRAVLIKAEAKQSHG